MDLIKPGEDSRKNWRSINQLELSRRFHAQLLGISSTIEADAENTPIAQQWSSRLHPFKIYQLPWHLRTGEPTAADWRKIRVRAGRVLESDATGTDGHDVDPDSEEFPTASDITVPEDEAEFWVWLEIDTVEDTTTAVVRYGTDPTAEAYGDWTTEKPWTDFPKLDGSHVPIAKIDSATNADNKTLLVRQYLRTDIISAGGTVRVKLCDPYTGEVKTYEIIGREITDPAPTP